MKNILTILILITSQFIFASLPKTSLVKSKKKVLNIVAFEKLKNKNYLYLNWAKDIKAKHYIVYLINKKNKTKQVNLIDARYNYTKFDILKDVEYEGYYEYIDETNDTTRFRSRLITWDDVPEIAVVHIDLFFNEVNNGNLTTESIDYNTYTVSNKIDIYNNEFTNEVNSIINVCNPYYDRTVTQKCLVVELHIKKCDGIDVSIAMTQDQFNNSFDNNILFSVMVNNENEYINKTNLIKDRLNRLNPNLCDKNSKTSYLFSTAYINIHERLTHCVDF